MLKNALICSLAFMIYSCSKKEEVIVPSNTFIVNGFNINGTNATAQYNINYLPTIKLSFSSPVNRSTTGAGISLVENGNAIIPLSFSFEQLDSTIVIQPSSGLKPLTRYVIFATNALKSVQGTNLQSDFQASFVSKIDSSDKFPILSDNQLLDTIQRRTFKYFWEFGHPVSGMARERNTSGDLVTTGGTGFGIMAIISAVNRNFITRIEGRDRILKITNFLTNNTTRYHGAFAHWINGSSGATLPFSSNDNGADLVETSFLLEGLI
ncbi:MAG: Ig-like domain-containing protein, partial [Ferruginibacter sp.]